LIVADEAPLSPYVYEGLDPVADRRPVRSALSEALQDTITLASWTIEAARKPGMPLGILSSITREAPLGSLMVAFMLGMAFARRRAR
jgi:ABC-type dipeptide/oligopeptide/nickel transport system permease component